MTYHTNRVFIHDMGTVDTMTVSDKTTETKEEEWLWHCNRMREHDGLPPLNLDNLPWSLTFTRKARTP